MCRPDVSAHFHSVAVGKPDVEDRDIGLGRWNPGERHGSSAGLSDHLETRVNIALGQRKGKITVEFASIEDLRRILGLMGVEPTP